jgi:hypothetical protein
MLEISSQQLASLTSKINSGLGEQFRLLDEFNISLDDDDAESDVDNCFVATEEEITEWIEEQEGSGGFTDAERAVLRASYIKNYPEEYPDIGAKYIVTNELSDGKESVFGLSLQVNQGQGGMRLVQFYGLFATHNDAMAAGKALEGIVFI